VKRWRVPAAGALAATVMVAIYLVAFHQPRATKIAGLAEETSQLLAQQAPLRRAIDALEKIQAREPEFRTALDLLEKLIPPRLAQPDLLAQTQAAAEAAGVELASVTFGDPKKPANAPLSPVAGTVLVALPLTVVVNGPFAGITSMLRRMEVGNERAVLVGAVALAESDDGFPQLTATWSGQAYALLPTDDPLLIDPHAPVAKATTTTTSEKP
jgi:Tfp pilus assembly protein PilO